MDFDLTKGAVAFFNACDLAKSLTGKTPETGTQCWIFNMDDSGHLNHKCEKCQYYKEFQKPETIRVEKKANLSLVFLPESMTEKGLPDLKKVFDGLINEGAKFVAVDCSSTKQINPQVLGTILRAFKSTREKGGEFFLLNPATPVAELLRSTMLIKIIPLSRSADDVERLIQEKEIEIKTGEAKRKAEEEEKKKKEAETLRCWDFWKGHNTNNATPCAVCHYKMTGATIPCWMIIGEIEGVTFEYINEECLDCRYYQKLNPEADAQKIL